MSPNSSYSSYLPFFVSKYHVDFVTLSLKSKNLPITHVGVYCKLKSPRRFFLGGGGSICFFFCRLRAFHAFFLLGIKNCFYNEWHAHDVSVRLLITPTEDNNHTLNVAFFFSTSRLMQTVKSSSLLLTRLIEKTSIPAISLVVLPVFNFFVLL